MAQQIFIVVIYRDGHQHVAPLYPRELDAGSALCVAREMAEGEGRACQHATDGDRIAFFAVKAADSLMAVNIACNVPSKRIVSGEFSL